MTVNNYTDSLVPVRFYRPYDANFFTVDNRPLVDINTNVNLVNNGADSISGANQFLTLIDQSTAVNTVLVYIEQAWSQGFLLNVKVANTNTGAVSIITDGSSTGPTAPVEMNDTPLTGGELIAGNWYILSFNGDAYNIVAGTAGTVSANAATASGQAVTQQTLLNEEPVSLVEVACTSLDVANASTLSGTATASSSASGSTDGVQVQQLTQGAAYSASFIDWTNVTNSTPLNVGQTASFFVTSHVANVPLRISCGENEIYEITLINFAGSTTNNDIVLLPNNTGYAGQFYLGGMEVGPINFSNYYTYNGTAAEYSIQPPPYFQITSANYGAGFYFDDIYGATNTPYLRVMQVFTGTSSSPAMGLNVSGGGIYATPSTSDVGMGTNLSVAVWDNTSTAYTDLGTVLIVPDAEWQILVRRIA